MLLAHSALAGLETVINKSLEYDPASRARLSHFSGKVLKIEATAPAVSLYLMPESDGVALMATWDGEVDACLTGSLASLARLPFGNHVNLYDTGVRFVGDTALISGLTQIAQTLDIDWEEIISQVLGDVLGPQAAALIKKPFGWLSNRNHTFGRLTQEFLTEELHALPSQSQLKQFYIDVDQLRFSVDRVDAKLRLLTSLS